MFTSKLIEKAAAHQLTSYILNNDLGEDFQYAYKKLHSTETTLIRVQNDILRARENEGTEREAQGVGQDMSCPRKLFLDDRKSVFRDVRMQSCLALRFLVKRENGGARGRLMKSLLFFQTSDRGWPACGRLGRQTSARTKTSTRLKITFVDMTYPKGWTGSLPLCPLIFSCCELLIIAALLSLFR